MLPGFMSLSRVLPTPFFLGREEARYCLRLWLLVSSFLFGCAGSLLPCRLSLVAASRVYSLVAWLLIAVAFLRRTGSRHRLLVKPGHTGLIAPGMWDLPLDQGSHHDPALAGGVSQPLTTQEIPRLLL